jgi:DNA-binding NarL/FixJ family response regulator
MTVVRSPDPTYESVAVTQRNCDLVVICSWSMARQGRHLTRSLICAHPSSRIVVIDDSSDDDTASNLFAAGACAVIGRHVSLQDAISIITSACLGDSTLRSSRTSPSSTDPPINDVTLSLRESEILQLAVDGINVSTMAHRLIISEKTVKHHLSAIYSKLGTTNRTDAVVRGLRLGLVDLDKE